MNNTKEPSPRERSIAYFALFAAWFLAVAFQGSTLHAFWAERGVAPGAAFAGWSIWANVAGLVAAGFVCTSPGRYRQVITGSMTLCLAAVLTLFSPVPAIWEPAMVVAAFFGGMVIAAWASDFKEFTPPGRRLSTAARAIMLANVLMIALNGISGWISPTAGYMLAAAALAAALVLAAAPRNSVRTFEASESGLVGSSTHQLKKSLLALYVFVTVLSVNSGLMYRIVLPAYAPATFFQELYWALPYIAAIYVLFRLPARINKSYVLYLAIVLVGLAFVLFFTLDRSVTSFLIVNTLMLGAFGVCDLFWWTILGEMLTFSDRPVQIFGVGLSANVLGIGIGVVIGQYLPLGESGARYPLIIALAVVMVTIMVLPLLYGRLASVVGDNDFLVGLTREIARKAVSESSGQSAPAAVRQEPHPRQPDPDPADIEALLENYLVRSELTLRERQIARLLQKGLTYRMIGQELQISENTVKSHIKNLYAKLQVDNKSEFIRKIQNILTEFKIIS